jgi:hypothetical protein
MTGNKYIGFSVEDLLHDQEFVSAVRSRYTSDGWEQFLQSYPESVTNMIEARKIILLFQTNEGTLADDRKNKLWKNVSRFNDQFSGDLKRFRLISFAKIAASLLLFFSLGGLIYQHFNRIENQYQFSESRNDIKTDNPLLVLSNGKTVELKKAESKIEVLKGKDAIQINNDQIVDNQISNEKTTIEAKFNEVIIPFGKKSKLILEDGTTVWLNAGSRFAFPQKFTGNKREVMLDGEAYFEVAKNVQKPFIISTDDLKIEVLGTKFNVSAYRSDILSETVLLEGSVKIWDNGKLFKDKILMVPNQKATYSKSGKEIVLEPEMEPELSVAWVEGWYQFKNENLEKVFLKLEKYYNVRFIYDQKIISGLLPVSGKLDLKDSLDEVMAVLSKVAKFKYQISGNRVIINK